MCEADKTVCKCVKSAGEKNPHVITSMSRLACTLFTWNCTLALISQDDRQAPVQTSLLRSWRAPFQQILLCCTPLLLRIWVRPVFISTFCLWKTVLVPVSCTHTHDNTAVCCDNPEQMLLGLIKSSHSSQNVTAVNSTFMFWIRPVFELH